MAVDPIDKDSKPVLRNLKTKAPVAGECTPTASCTLTPVHKTEGFLPKGLIEYSRLSLECDEGSLGSSGTEANPEELRKIPAKKIQSSLVIGSIPFCLQTQCTVPEEAIAGKFLHRLAVIKFHLHDRTGDISMYRFNRKTPS